MVKNWADHDSSDEEDLLTPEEQIKIPIESGGMNHINDRHELVEGPSSTDNNNNNNHQDSNAPPEEPPPPRTYDFPTEAPFTAYVGNLAYNMIEANDLGDALVDLAKERLGLEIKVVHARIMMDRQNAAPGDKPRHRGFGYVEVETLDQLKKLMELNDGQTFLAGRKIQVDTANHASGGGGGGGGGGRGGDRGGGDRGGHRGGNRGGERGSFGPPDVDGSKFRGGRFSGREGGGADRGPGGGTGSSGPPGERPRLKLQTRSKPKEDGDKAGAAASIFGGAKPRDEQSWAERRKSDNQGQATSERKREPRGGGGGGRGDRGGRGGDRGGGRGDRDGAGGRGRSAGRGEHDKERTKEHPKEHDKEHKKEHNKEHSKEHKNKDHSKDNKDKWSRGAKKGEKPVEKKKAAAAPPAISQPEKPVEKKVINTFAALDFGSDSE
jgi:hypothetical protein